MHERIIMPGTGIMLYVLKKMPIKYELVQEVDGNYSCWTVDGIITHGTGATELECRRDLISSLQDIAEEYMNKFEDWFEHNPQEFPEVLKIINSSSEDLLECLTLAN